MLTLPFDSFLCLAAAATGQIFSYGFNRWAPDTVTRGLASQFVVAEELQMAPVRKFCTGFDYALVLYVDALLRHWSNLCCQSG